MNIKILKEYMEYLKSGKPTEGKLRIDPGYCQLWALEEIDKLNDEYKVHELAPAHKGFGSSGGGEMLAFNSKGQVAIIPFIGMSDEDAVIISESWIDFEKAIII